MSKLHKVGLTLGKFSPPHRGHKLMLDYGTAMCDELFVIVSGITSIPINQRVKWLREITPSFDVVIYDDPYFDEIPESEMDELGVAIDDNFWKAWIDGITQKLPKIDAIFTNDWYGEKLARLLDAKWYPIDTNRTTNTISATKVKDNIFRHYNEIIEPAKEHFQRTIAVVGPESTGKSMLTETLANFYEQGYAHEYGRTVSEIRDCNFTEEDFISIGIGQKALIDSAHEKYPVVFTDTEAFTTYLYAGVYVDDPSDDFLFKLYVEANQQRHDFYILLAPTMEWVDDGTRVMNKLVERKEFFTRMKAHLEMCKCKYVVVSETSWDARTDRALEYVTEYLENTYEE